ncbi:hypothetical protein EMPS_00465 [Entomortierella parvispora]|uniref:Uncharacterized protein n=1 Tax=Entomortierella parvispora TaxID=205924 RepID=A0A9P3H112_9FUNG|nr:hypothetical protein EMPS_00465 [Entomortierella parvispora]
MNQGQVDVDGLDHEQKYEVVIGVSTSQNLCIPDIEMITIQFHNNCEVIEAESLDEMFRDGEKGTLLWKFDSLLKFESPGNRSFQWRIDFTLKPVSGNFQPRVIYLHHLELHPEGTRDWVTDATARIHRPRWKWSVDLKINQSQADTSAYAISESGNYLVTYRSTILEIWDLNNMTQEIPNLQQSVTGLRNRSARPCAISQTIVLQSSTIPWLSISWDGKQVALYDEDQMLKVFEINPASATLSNQPLKLRSSTNLDALKNEDLDGAATFHSGAKGREHYDPEEERILILTKDCVKIFSVQGPWKHIWTVTVNNLRSIQGRLFLSRDESDKSISVWNIDTGRVQCIIKTDRHHWDMMSTIALSKDAAFLLETRQDSIVSYCSATGARLAIKYRSSAIRPVNGRHEQFHTDKGSVLDGEDLTETYRLRDPGLQAAVVHMTENNSNFESIVNDNSLLGPNLWKPNPCNDECLANLEEVKDNILTYEDDEIGLRFKIEKVKLDPDKRGLALTISDNWGTSRTTLLPGLSLGSATTFSPKDQSLVVIDSDDIEVLQMPATVSEDPMLISIHYQEEEGGLPKHNKYHDRQEYFNGKPCKLIKQCPHGRLYVAHPRCQFKSLFSLRQPLPVMPSWTTHEDFHLHVNYLNRHINRPTSQQSKTSEMVITDTAEMTTMELLCKYSLRRDQLLEKILTLPDGRWIPQLRTGFNPTEFLLDRAKTDAIHMKAFRLFWNYCLQKAKEDQSTHFLASVAACLPTLLDKKSPHSEVAKSTLHRMAFVPVPSRSFIMERHALIHPPEFRPMFWKPNPRPLFKCQEPILQLESLGKRQLVKDPGNDTFLHEIFSATFNVIWTDTGEPAKPTKTSFPAGVPPSVFYWIKMSVFVAIYRLSPWRERKIKSHDFPLDAFDNLAVAALISYKWYTLGFYTWLTRFMLQCFYYLLVIIVVVLQIDDAHMSTALFGVIAGMSILFLLLELSQVLHNPRRYVR